MKKSCLGIFLFYLGLLSAFGQQDPTTPIKVVKDTAKTTTKEKETVVLKVKDTVFPDGKKEIIGTSKNKYDLKDNEAAAKYDSIWLKKLYDSASFFDTIYKAVTSPAVEVAEYSELNTDTLKLRLQKLNEKTPFNIAYNPALESYIKSYLKRRRGLMERMLTISQFYFPMFEQELDNYDIPLEIKYLAIVESALNPRARSRVGATGLWQFMYGTGRENGLYVSSYVDERSDPIKSTKAACEYLTKMYDVFGDWDLVLAAYNSGPGNVNKAIRRSGGYKNYWNIRNFLPRETAGYVPAFLTTLYLFEYAEEHGLTGEKVHRPFFETDTIHVKSTITFDQISKLVNVTKEELKVLNPQYKLNIIPFVKDKNYALRLPKKAMGKFVNNEKAIYTFVEKELKTIEKPLPKLVNSQDKIRYRVKSGDYLGKIANRYRVSVSAIKRWNGLRNNNLKVGQRLTIFPRKPLTNYSKPSTKKVAVNQTIKPGTKVHTVQDGDSLWIISRKYPGISIDNLREWNGISGNNLKPGTKLKLCDCPS